MRMCWPITKLAAMCGAVGPGMVFTGLLEAQTLDQVAVAKLAEAPSVSAVREVHRQLERIRVERLACRLQLAKKTVPSACYRAAHLEREWGLPQGRELLARLDRQCARASEKMQELQTIDERSLSPKCLKRVRKARELLAYILETP